MSDRKDQINWWHVFLGLVIFLLIIITAGLVLAVVGNKQEKTKEEDESDKVTRLSKRLIQLNQKIEPLSGIRDELRNRERKRLLWIRIVIACSITLANLLMWKIFNPAFDVGLQVNFNEAGLLIYALFGFIIAGTPSRFAVLLKLGVSRWSIRKHKPMLIYLESLEHERDEIIKELLALEAN